MERAPHRKHGAERNPTFAQARAELGDRGESFGCAYAWNARRGTYDFVRTYADAPERVTRYLVCERPNAETRERRIARFPMRVAQSHADPTVRVFDAWNGTRRPRSMDVALARTRPRVAHVAPGNPNAEGYVAHTCPPEDKGARVREDERRDGMPNVPHTCTRTHATHVQGIICKRMAPRIEDLHAQAYAETIARINARER